MKLVRSGMLVKKKVGIGVRGAVAHSPRLAHRQTVYAGPLTL